jgi:hypothetical protein
VHKEDRADPTAEIHMPGVISSEFLSEMRSYEVINGPSMPTLQLNDAPITDEVVVLLARLAANSGGVESSC